MVSGFGMERAAAAPQLFKTGRLLLEAHVGDIHAAGPGQEMYELAAWLETVVRVKEYTVFPYCKRASTNTFGERGCLPPWAARFDRARRASSEVPLRSASRA